jgi:ATP-dependent DNA helicase HFM1/MER3
MVVLKGTVEYTGSATQDMSDIKVLQMIGRAGRPQFDTSAVALIATTVGLAPKYTNLVRWR